jgi:hypothetical protein
MAIPRLRHLCGHLETTPAAEEIKDNAAYCLTTLTLGDMPEAWRKAGFSVSNDTVVVGDISIRLTGAGGGLRQIGFSGCSMAHPLQLPGVETVIAPTRAQQVLHPNTTTSLAEVVLYAQRLQEFVTGMRRAGVQTHKRRDPQPIGDHSVATFLFPGQKLRLLVFGPNDEASDPSRNPKMWMMGHGLGHGSTELTGYLPLVREHPPPGVVSDCVGPSKEAVQKGRRIATLPAGTIEGLTGTFAFLSRGEGELF